MKVLMCRGKEIILDDDIFEKVCGLTWRINKYGYVLKDAPKDYGSNVIFIHHFILPKRKDLVVDHINQNKLDNRRENLRYATKSQNAFNSKIRADNTTGVKGISKCNHRDLYHAYMNVNGKRIQNWFKNFEDAVNYRKELEKKYN